MYNTLNTVFNEQNIHSLWMFQKTSFDNVDVATIRPDTDTEKKAKRENLILCRSCGSTITSPKNIIEINGSHAHTFTNPTGNTFKIGCFSSADGCLLYGEHTMEYTWFPGFGWCYALCSDCNTHLGWNYKSHDSEFYGLILDNLIENI